MNNVKKFNDQALYVFIAFALITVILFVLDITIGGGLPGSRSGAFRPLIDMAGEFATITSVVYIASLALRLWKSREFWDTIAWLKEHPSAGKPVRLPELDDELADLNDKTIDGWVYLVRGPQGWYKIGHTKNPDDRRTTFGVKLPFDVKFDHLIKCKNRREAEVHLHKVFAHRRGNGEWFRLTADDITTIKAIKEM